MPIYQLCHPADGRGLVRMVTCAFINGGFAAPDAARRRHGGKVLHRSRILEQPDLQVLAFVDDFAVDFDDAVADAEDELAVDDALDVDAVGDFFGVGQNLTGELDFADAERAARARGAGPTKVKAEQLPDGIKAKA